MDSSREEDIKIVWVAFDVVDEFVGVEEAIFYFFADFWEDSIVVADGLKEGLILKEGDDFIDNFERSFEVVKSFQKLDYLISSAHAGGFNEIVGDWGEYFEHNVVIKHFNNIIII